MIKIGWSRKDISTDKPINLPGQFHWRISKGVLDPVYATALAIANGDGVVIFMSIDSVYANGGVIDVIREKALKINPLLPADKILLSATHTHSAPSHYYEKDITVPPHEGIEVASSDEYCDFMTGECAKAACEAYASMSDGAVAYGYGYAVVSHSRRVVYMDDLSKRPGADTESSLIVDGHARMYGDTNDKMFSGYESGSDHFINILYTFDNDEKLTGAVINVPCPSQNSEQEYLISSDYWHNVRELLQQKYGDIKIITQCSAAGDLAPRILHYKEAQKRRYALKFENAHIDERVEGREEYMNRLDIAERITNAFTEVLSWAKKDMRRNDSVIHTVRTIDLEKRLITDDEYMHSVNCLEDLKNKSFVKTDDPSHDLRENSWLVSRRTRFEDIIDRYEEQKKSKTESMEMHVIRIGDIAFASNPYELYMDFAHRIEARSPFMQTFIVQLSAQPSGYKYGTYLATEKGAANVGYSATMFCNMISPQGGQTLVEETLKDLEKLYK